MKIQTAAPNQRDFLQLTPWRQRVPNYHISLTESSGSRGSSDLLRNQLSCKSEISLQCSAENIYPDIYSSRGQRFKLLEQNYYWFTFDNISDYFVFLSIWRIQQQKNIEKLFSFVSTTMIFSWALSLIVSAGIKRPCLPSLGLQFTFSHIFCIIKGSPTFVMCLSEWKMQMELDIVRITLKTFYWAVKVKIMLWVFLRLFLFFRIWAARFTVSWLKNWNYGGQKVSITAYKMISKQMHYKKLKFTKCNL